MNIQSTVKVEVGLIKSIGRFLFMNEMTDVRVNYTVETIIIIDGVAILAFGLVLCSLQQSSSLFLTFLPFSVCVRVSLSLYLSPPYIWPST